MDVNQTIVEFTNHESIAMEQNINQICFRDMVNYVNSLREENTVRDLSGLFNPKRSDEPTINLDVLIQYISDYYNCDSPADISDLSCKNPQYSEQFSVDDRVIVNWIECETEFARDNDEKREFDSKLHG